MKLKLILFLFISICAFKSEAVGFATKLIEQEVESLTLREGKIAEEINKASGQITLIRKQKTYTTNSYNDRLKREQDLIRVQERLKAQKQSLSDQKKKLQLLLDRDVSKIALAKASCAILKNRYVNFKYGACAGAVLIAGIAVWCYRNS